MTGNQGVVCVVSWVSGCKAVGRSVMWYGAYVRGRDGTSGWYFVRASDGEPPRVFRRPMVSNILSQARSHHHRRVCGASGRQCPV